MVPEAPLEQTDAGARPAGEGWFVLNALDAVWSDHELFGVTQAGCPYLSPFLELLSAATAGPWNPTTRGAPYAAGRS